MFSMKEVRQFALPIALGLGFIVMGVILCPPSFWDSLFGPYEELITEISLLNGVGFGLALAGVFILLIILLKIHLSSKIS